MYSLLVLFCLSRCRQNNTSKNTWIDKTTPSNYLHRQDYTSKTVWRENTTPVNMSRKTKQHQYNKNYLDRQNNTSKEFFFLCFFCWCCFVYLCICAGVVLSI
jgi:hypothetical protein